MNKNNNIDINNNIMNINMDIDKWHQHDNNVKKK